MHFPGLFLAHCLLLAVSVGTLLGTLACYMLSPVLHTHPFPSTCLQNAFTSSLQNAFTSSLPPVEGENSFHYLKIPI